MFIIDSEANVNRVPKTAFYNGIVEGTRNRNNTLLLFWFYAPPPYITYRFCFNSYYIALSSVCLVLNLIYAMSPSALSSR